MGKQTFIVKIDEQTAREVLEFLRGDHGYRSLDEFLEVAACNQLNVEKMSDPTLVFGKAVEDTPPLPLRLLARPEGAARPELALHPDVSSENLFVLTNRLAPMKVGLRVLASWAQEGWPSLTDFQEVAALAARELGLRLRSEDAVAKRPPSKRRWIGFPVGDDKRAAFDRFAFSFTINARNGGKPAGPLAILGLANVVGGRVILTEEGWRLAVEASPLIDGVAGDTLSATEAQIFIHQILRAPKELESVKDFLRIVKRAAGRQSRVDELLSAQHSDWTTYFASAKRSSMIGRLADLRVLEVAGRGPDAIISLLPGADVFQSHGHNEEGGNEAQSQAV